MNLHFYVFRNPNLDDNAAVPTWPTFDNINQQYLELDVNMTSESVKHHLAASRVAFWEHLVPVLAKCSTSGGSCNLTVASCLVKILFCVFLVHLSNK
jgi:hypothetical protein